MSSISMYFHFTFLGTEIRKNNFGGIVCILHVELMNLISDYDIRYSFANEFVIMTTGILFQQFPPSLLAFLPFFWIMCSVIRLN